LRAGRYSRTPSSKVSSPTASPCFERK
jgi:hypothetical protein